jgi:uncharacterized protein YkwD
MSQIFAGAIGVGLAGLGGLVLARGKRPNPQGQLILLGSSAVGIIVLVTLLVTYIQARRAGPVGPVRPSPLTPSGPNVTTTIVQTPSGPMLMTQEIPVPRPVQTSQGTVMVTPQAPPATFTPLPTFETPATKPVGTQTPSQSQLDEDFRKWLEQNNDPFAISVPTQLPTPPPTIIPKPTSTPSAGLPTTQPRPSAPTFTKPLTSPPTALSTPSAPSIPAAPSAPAPSVTGSKLTQAEANEMLLAHNDRRATIGTTSATKHLPIPSPPIPPLEWDADLAANAQKWSDVMLSEDRMFHSDSSMRQYNGKTSGQNIAYDMGMMASPTNKVEDWFDSEAPHYNYNSNSCAPGEQCGHYSQIAWRNSKKLGCGVSRSGKTQYWTCEFSPGGNFTGQKPY